MYRTIRIAARATLLSLALMTGVAHADWNVGQAYKMHFPQLPDPSGYDVNFTAPMAVADDWRCTDTGPVQDIHFWFSARQDWLNLQLPMDSQIQGIHVIIYADVPGTPASGPSHPGRLLWQRNFNSTQFKIRQYGTGSQFWYDPATGLLTPNDHQKIFQCNITNIQDAFYQKRGTIYWLSVSVSAINQVGWKSSDQSKYPAPYTGNHYQDDATWQPASTATWTDLHYLVGAQAGQSMDMAFVITGFRRVFNYKMHFPQYPDPTGADVNFSFPRLAADDWKCSESGPVDDIHFWFSAFGDWLSPTVPPGQQIGSIFVSIYSDAPANAANPFSHPDSLLWQRAYPAADVHIKFDRFITEGQAWYDPQQGYVPMNHYYLYECDVDSIVQPFIQTQGHIYWLAVSMQSEGPLGWKTADEDLYPAPFTGNHFLDDATWVPDYLVPIPPPLPWQPLTWPAGLPNGGQSFDLSFVITRLPPPTGAGKVPGTYHLEQNYPNPFNPTTTIRYTLPAQSSMELAVFGVDGRLVRVLDSGSKPAGTFEAKWDGRDASGNAVASGVYFYRLKAGSFTETKKMVLLK